MTRLFFWIEGRVVWLASCCWDHPRRVIGLAVLGLALSVVSGMGVEFRSDLQELAPAAIGESVGRVDEIFGLSDNVVRGIRMASPLPAPPSAGDWTFVFDAEESY